MQGTEGNVREVLNLPYEFEVGGRAFHARALNLREECELEDAMGKDFDAINLDSAKARLTILWLMMRQEDPKITRDQVGELARGDERQNIARVVLSGIAGKQRADEMLGANPLPGGAPPPVPTVTTTEESGAAPSTGSTSPPS